VLPNIKNLNTQLNTKQFKYPINLTFNGKKQIPPKPYLIASCHIPPTKVLKVVFVDKVANVSRLNSQTNNIEDR